MFTTNNSVQVHPRINGRTRICDGQPQRLMWGSEVEIVFRGSFGRVLVKWQDLDSYWYGWTNESNLTDTLNAIF
jgi:hypothetical protein